MVRIAWFITVIWLLSACDNYNALDKSEMVTQNVVLICIDTVRADTFYSLLESEDMNWSEKKPTLFKQAQSAAPWTIPSLSSVLTGTYPSKHHAGRFSKNIANLETDIPSGISKEIPTLPDLLKPENFFSNVISAHPWFEGGFDLEKGFNQVDLRKTASGVLDWFEHNLKEQQIKQETTGFINQFYYLHFMEAHDWHLKSEVELDQLIQKANIPHSEILKLAPNNICEDSSDLMCKRFTVYVYAIKQLQETLSSFFSILESNGMKENTMVILFSDHGEEFHDHFENGQSNHSDPRKYFGFGHGHSLYQEVIRVPLMVWHPKIDGQTINQPVSLVDIAPSILELLDIEIPSYFDGTSFAHFLNPVYEKQDHSSWVIDNERIIYSTGIAYGSEQIAIRITDDKAIWQIDANKTEYFDLNEDPLERNSLTEPQSSFIFNSYFADIFSSLKSKNSNIKPNLDDEQIKRLQSIGYLQGVDQ